MIKAPCLSIMFYTMFADIWHLAADILVILSLIFLRFFCDSYVLFNNHNLTNLDYSHIESMDKRNVS